MLFGSSNSWRSGILCHVQAEDESDLASVMAAADLDGDGTLNYEEFIAATASLSKLEREDNILAAFKQFDTDHSGALSKAEVMQALVSMGSSEQEVSVRPPALPSAYVANKRPMRGLPITRLLATPLRYEF